MVSWRARLVSILVVPAMVVGALVSPVPTVSAHQPHDPMVSLALSPAFASDSTLFVGTAQLTVDMSTTLLLKSTDGALTWQVSPGFPGYMAGALAVSPSFASDGIVFAGTSGDGLLRSGDRGATWTAVSSFPSSDVSALAFSPAFSADHTIFAAASSGSLFRSSDGGTTWTRVGSSAFSANVIVVSPAYSTDQTVFVGSSGQGVLKSTNGGSTYKAVDNGLPDLHIAAVTLSPSYSTDHTLFASIIGSGVYMSTDSGATWVAVNQGLSDLHINGLAISPGYSVDHTIFAMSYSGTVFKSAAATPSWAATAAVPRPLSRQFDIHDFALAVSPAYTSDQTLVVAMYEGVYKSTDGGNSWQYSETLPPSLVRQMSISPSFSTDHTVVAADYGGGMQFSVPFSPTWQFHDTNLVDCFASASALSPNYANDHEVFAGTVRGPSTLINTGSGAPPKTGPRHAAPRVVTQSSGPRQAAQSSGSRHPARRNARAPLPRRTLHRVASSAGPSWTLLPVLGVTIGVRALALSPAFSTDQTVYLGAENSGSGNPITTTYQGHTIWTMGLFVSTDGGTNWAPTAINGTAIQSIGLSPNFAADATIFAASNTGGLFKSTDRGQTFVPLTGLPSSSVDPVAVSPNYSVDQTVLAVVPAGPPSQRGLWKSTDGGSTWAVVPGSQGLSIQAVAFSPNYATDRAIFVGTLEHGLMLSTDGGATLVASSLSDPYVTAMAVSPSFATDRTLYVATYRGIWESTDGAATWTLLNLPVRYEVTQPSIQRTGPWTQSMATSASCQNLLSASMPSSTLQFTFKGTQITWIGPKSNSSGLAQVYLDGVLQTTVDLYAPTYQAQQVLYQSALLPTQAHTIQIVVTGQHDPQARGSQVTLNSLVVLP